MDAVVCEHHAYGGAGAAKLGEAVISACQQKVDFQFLYDLHQPIKVGLPLLACTPHPAHASVLPAVQPICFLSLQRCVAATHDHDAVLQEVHRGNEPNKQ